MINNQINNQINLPKCYYLNNVTLINNNNYLLLSVLSGIASFYIGNLFIKCFYKLRNRVNNDDILMASIVSNDINNDDN